MKKLILTLFIIWNSSLFGASTDLAGVRVSVAQGLSEANAMYEKGEYDSAWALLSRLVREDPTNADINVLMLKVANKTARFNQSIAIMERLVEQNPNNAKLHLELSKAYAIAGDKENSNAQMQIAKELDSSLASANLEYELNRRATRAQNQNDRLQIAGNISVGLTYNSNVNSGLDGLDVVIGSMPLKLNDVAGKKSGWGEYMGASLNAGYKVREDSQWWAVGDINAYALGYNNKVPANQYFAWGRVGAGLRYLGATDLFEVRLKAENGIYRPEENMFAGGFESTWVHAFTPNWQSILSASFERRNYAEQDGRDGSYYSAGGYLRYLWGGSAANYAMFGAKAIGASSTKEEMYAYSGWEAMLRLNISPVAKLDISPFAAYREQDYKDAATKLSKNLGENDRSDKTYIGGTTLVWHWSESFSSELGYQYTKNSSNSDLYDYNQHQVNLGLTYSF